MKTITNKNGTTTKLIEDKDLVYSNEEVDTGKTWVNGKSIYRYVFEGSTVVSNRYEKYEN